MDFTWRIKYSTFQAVYQIRTEVILIYFEDKIEDWNKSPGSIKTLLGFKHPSYLFPWRLCKNNRYSGVSSFYFICLFVCLRFEMNFVRDSWKLGIREWKAIFHNESIVELVVDFFQVIWRSLMSSCEGKTEKAIIGFYLILIW